MGNYFSLRHRTHIANAYSKEIQAKVTVNKEKLVSTQSSTNVGGGFAEVTANVGSSEEKKFEQLYQHPGFIKIMPDNYLAFNISGDDGRVYVSIISGSRIIADNFPVINNHSVIVDANGCIQHTEYGEIWTDLRQHYHA